MYNLAILPLLIIMLIITYISAFDKQGKPKCDHYVLNCYLYAVTYLVMMLWFIILFIEKNIDISSNLWAMIGLAIASFVSYLAIIFIPKDMVILKHLISVIFISISALLLTTLFLFFELKSIIFAVVMAIILFLILTGFAWKFQEMISSKISLTFVIIAIVFIVVEMLVGIFMPGSILEKIIISIVLLIMCYFLLVKTKKMIENSQTCIEDKGPDYVKEGTGFVVILESFFIRLLELFGKSKVNKR